MIGVGTWLLIYKPTSLPSTTSEKQSTTSAKKEARSEAFKNKALMYLKRGVSEPLGDIKIYDLYTEKIKSITIGTKVYSMVPSPNNKKLAYEKDLETSEGLYTYTFALGKEEKLVDVPNKTAAGEYPFISSYIWSNDGESIAYIVASPTKPKGEVPQTEEGVIVGKNQLNIITLKDGKKSSYDLPSERDTLELVAWLDNEIYFINPFTLYFGSRDGIRSFNTSTKLTKKNMFPDLDKTVRIDSSPDSTKLAYLVDIENSSDPNEVTLKVVDLKNNGAEILNVKISTSQNMGWLNGARGYIYSLRQGGKDSLNVYNFTTKETKSIGYSLYPPGYPSKELFSFVYGGFSDGKIPLTIYDYNTHTSTHWILDPFNGTTTQVPLTGADTTAVLPLDLSE